MTDFEEEQRPSPVLLTAAAAVIALIGVFSEAVSPPDDAHNNAVLLSCIWAVAVIWVVWFTLRMKTEVSGDGVRIRTLYVVKRLIRFNEIAQADPVAYRPLLDYGGWGLRASSKGKAYNIRGNRGVQLVLKNGGRVLVGSQREEELANAIVAGMKEL